MKKILYFCSFYRPHIKLFAFDMFCAFIVAVCNLVYPYIARDIINVYAPRGEIRLILIWAGVLLGIYILKAILDFCVQYWGHIVGIRIQGDMREELFKKVEKLPFTYFDNNQTGVIMSRIVNDLMEISELAHHGPEGIFLSFLTILGASIMISTINIYLALIVLGVIILISIFAVSRRRKQKAAFHDARQKIAIINASIESSLSGIRVTKAYGNSLHEIEKFNKSNEEFKVSKSEAYRQMGIFSSGMHFFNDFLYLLSISIGGIFMARGIINAGEFAMFVLYISTLIAPLRSVVELFEQLQQGVTGFENFLKIMNEKEEEDKVDAKDLLDIKDSIEYKNVSFSYGENKKNVLSSFNLKINAGDTVALVGPTGGGKTTICHLLPRFYGLDEGEILIDGVNYLDYKIASLRNQIALVSQDVYLFTGSIRENIAYGNFSASEEEIIEAAKRANIYDFVMSLDNKFDTFIGERGVKLSGGQKQRISIARAFLKNPKILILDEATSALDNATEMQIQSALESLSKGRTTIVVAHRLSTVKNANQIVVIGDKGIIEQGTHEELIDRKGEYYSLYQYQFK